MYEKCFYFLLNSSFSGQMVFLRKLKLIYPSIPKDYNNCPAHTFLILFKEFLDPPPFKKEGRDGKLLIQSLEWLFHNFSETHHFTDHAKNNCEKSLCNMRNLW